MADAYQYATLITSLPHPGKLFAEKQTPLSRIQLEKRLGMLEERDAALLKQVVDLLLWGQLPMDRTDAEIVQQARRLVPQLDDPMLREIVESRLELRTVVAALRRRKRGDGPPSANEPWGYGRWLGHIQRCWTDPGFRLEGVFPWVTEAHRLLNAGDAMGLERLLLSVVWDNLGRAGEQHYFDFVAVVIYVLRWHIVARWSIYDGAAAAQRFTELVDAGLGEQATLFN